MGKVAKLKKGAKGRNSDSTSLYESILMVTAASVHSRAARRATSPSLNTDKSLKTVKPPSDHDPLGVQHAAGVTKRKAKSKAMTRAARMRQERGLERAEVVMDQREKKLQKSFTKGRSVNDRRATWEQMNTKIKTEKPHKEEKIPTEADWEDDEEAMSEAEVVEGVSTLRVGDVQHSSPSGLSQDPLPEDDNEDVIL